MVRKVQKLSNKLPYIPDALEYVILMDYCYSLLQSAFASNNNDNNSLFGFNQCTSCCLPILTPHLNGYTELNADSYTEESYFFSLNQMKT